MEVHIPDYTKTIYLYADSYWIIIGNAYGLYAPIITFEISVQKIILN